MSALPLSPQVFAILSALIEEHTGIHYGPADLDLVRDKISVRALDAGFESLLDYYYFLRYDPESRSELDALIDSLVVNETYFFRELEPVRVLVEHLVPDVLSRRPRARIWSAACSTGEEPITLAMLLEEKGLLGRVDLVASDISRRALGQARSGRFGRRSLRHIPRPDLLASHGRYEGETYVVSPSLLSRIDFRQVNLTSAAEVAAVGPCDFILCRNVLIYFRDDVARTVVDNLAAALPPDGALLVGVSESLMRFSTTLGCEEKYGIFLYRRTRP